jgi:ankyrin repeat protein
MTNSRRDFFWQAAAAAGIARAQEAHAKPDIFQAAAAGDTARAAELLNADATLARARAADGRTALHFAAAAGKAAMVTLLVTRGAIIDAGPEPALLAALEQPDREAASEIARFLLSNAANPEARRQDGKSALEIAKEHGYRDIAEFLIHRGGKAAASEAAGIERVHYGQRYARDLQSAPVKRDDLNGLPWTAVNQFASFAHVDFDKVKELFQATPALLNTRASWDESAIEAAAHMGRFEMAAWLAERGFAVSTCTAALLGQETLVKASLATDPLAVHERGAHDIALLAYTAFAREQTAIAERLLKAGANPDARAFTRTTLHLAAAKGYADLAALLIGHGADINARYKEKSQWFTPLGAAVQAKQSRVEQLLRDRGAEL